MDNCGKVQMNRYWNFVAVPTFIATMFFGIYVLFTTDEAHFASRDEVKDTVRAVQEALTAPKPASTST